MLVEVDEAMVDVGLVVVEEIFVVELVEVRAVETTVVGFVDVVELEVVVTGTFVTTVVVTTTVFNVAAWTAANALNTLIAPTHSTLGETTRMMRRGKGAIELSIPTRATFIAYPPYSGAIGRVAED